MRPAPSVTKAKRLQEREARRAAASFNFTLKLVRPGFGPAAEFAQSHVLHPVITGAVRAAEEQFVDRNLQHLGQGDQRFRLG